MTRGRKVLAVTALCGVVILALSVGPGSFEPDFLSWLTVDSWQRDVLLRVRLPRVLLAGLAGAGLSVSGLGLQASFRNPLAEPTMLGTSAASVLGTLTALYLLPVHNAWLIFASSLLFALVATLVLATSLVRSELTGTLLTGLAISSLCGALSMVLLSLALSKWELGQQMVRWSLGSFEERSLNDALLLLPFVAIQIFATSRLGTRLDAITLGPSHAASLGVNVTQVVAIVLLLSAASTAITTAMVGTIGFVGLLVPNVIRHNKSPKYRESLWICAVLGAALVIFADTLSRWVTPWGDLRPGAITGLLGAPYLVYLAISLHRRGHLSP